MEDEIEDLVGDVRYTDSQKSVTTSNAYSPDFTDSSSDKNHSSGKDTYVIDWDDSDDSDKTFQIQHNLSIIDMENRIEDRTPKTNLIVEPNVTNKSACTSLHKCSIISHEIYTQTSKTIFELVSKETDLQVTRDSKTLQTQTSLLSISENKTIEYNAIEVTIKQENFTKQESFNESSDCQHESGCNVINDSQNPNTSQEDSSTKYPESETQNEITDDASSESTFSDQLVIQFIDAESHENIPTRDIDKNSCDLESSKFDSDIEEDSLMLNESRQDNITKLDSISYTSVPKSIDNDVKELYNKMSESIDIFSPEKPMESNLRNFGTLTPLTEETTPKKNSIIDVTPSIKTIAKPIEKEANKSSIVTKSDVRPSVSANSNMIKENFKLPPIHKNKSCPNSPNLNFLFAINTPIPIDGHGFLGERGPLLDRWEHTTKYLAGGESPLISGKSGPVRCTNDTFRLPPIHVEGIVQNSQTVQYFTTSRINNNSKESSFTQGSINIKDKIRELKVTDRKSRRSISRAGSPSSTSSPDEIKMCDVAERGGDALCAEVLRKLRSTSWTEAAETLEEMPHVLEKFWGVLTENRIADLIRQVNIHIDSPRTHLARLACNTIAEILKKTNYTRKPDFYEAMTTLLTKTGSLSRPVRRAANVALDDIVSGAELSLAVTALCVHGVGHKSPLVRCAAARLLVVCCALAEGGRLLLRGRPPSAAAARRHALRALAVLLDDKNIETRKYAARLYTMLRPLTNFEAYFLTDVDVELAARQMKKYDQILLSAKSR